jgi:diacylglycerol kinase family enzyme
VYGIEIAPAGTTRGLGIVWKGAQRERVRAVSVGYDRVSVAGADGTPNVKAVGAAVEIVR